METRKRLYNNPIAAPTPVRDNAERLWEFAILDYDAIDTVGAAVAAIRNCETALLAAQQWKLAHSEDGRIKPECDGPGMLGLLNSFDLEISALHLLIDIYNRRFEQVRALANLGKPTAVDNPTRGTNND